MKVDPEKFTNSVKGKIIIATLVACVALFLAWSTTQLVFKEMLTTVDEISTPGKRLRFVHQLSLRIIALDQIQKSEVLQLKNNYKGYLDKTKQVSLSLDTLKELYQNDQKQLQRIASIKQLLKERNRLFLNYLKFREGFLNTAQFSEQVNSLNKLVDESSRKTDSTIQQSQKRTLTTTIYNVDKKEEEPKGFFNKLFGKRKLSSGSDGMNMVSEETSVELDTINLAEQDSLLKDLTATMRNLEENQRKKSRQFKAKEANLANSGDLLINKVLDILKEVETNALKQVEQSNQQAVDMVNLGTRRMGVIMLVFIGFILVLLILIFKDISKSKRYQKMIEKARDEAESHSQAKQRFLSNMSHEIRTPLQSIVGYTEVIKNQAIPNQKFITAIDQSSKHLIQIVDEILDYNRIVSGKLSFHPATFDLTGLIDEVLAVMKPQAEQKGIKLFTDLDFEDHLITGDSFRLKQILYNLIGNAIKFTPKGYVALNLSAKREKKFLHCVFSVEDSGVGMPENSLHKIFNEFEQVESSGSSKGSGLGLSISKKIIEAQGGRISVKSKPGEGTAFTFYLRFELAEDSPKVNHLDTEQVLLPQTFTDKVWVVDDDPLILDLFAIILEKNHIRFQTFSSAKALLSAPDEAELKYILSDLRMPEMSGQELCRLLKEKLPPEVKIIAITAQVLPEEKEKVLQSGFDGLLIKPFNEAQLLNIFGLSPHVASSQFNTTYLEKMTYGDPVRIREILKRYREDCLQDVQLAEDMIKVRDEEKLSLIIHRLAGRNAQLGVDDFAESFRNIEQQLETDQPADKSVFALIEAEILRQRQFAENLNM